MKKEASRFMPKYKTAKMGLIGFLRLIFFVLLAIYLIYLVFSTPFYITLIPIIGVLIYFENRRTKNKFLLLAKGRQELNIGDFARSFDIKKIDTWVIRAVYEQLQEYVGDGLTIKADDSLFDLLEIDEEDLEYVFEEIAQRTGRSLDDIETNKYFERVHRVRDVVYLFNEQPLTSKVE